MAHRYIYIIIEKYYSPLSTFNQGIPMGFDISPSVFSIYIRTIEDIIRMLMIFNYLHYFS